VFINSILGMYAVYVKGFAILSGVCASRSLRDMTYMITCNAALAEVEFSHVLYSWLGSSF